MNVPTISSCATDTATPMIVMIMAVANKDIVIVLDTILDKKSKKNFDFLSDAEYYHRLFKVSFI